MRKLHIAVVQIDAGGDIGRNLKKVSNMVGRITGADLIALPEVFALRGSNHDYRETAESLDGPIVTAMAALARMNRSWVLAGSIIEKAGRHIYNTSVLLNRSGKIAATYRKMHLFEARLENGKHIRESDAYEAGKVPVCVDIEGWRAGLANRLTVQILPPAQGPASEGLARETSAALAVLRDEWILDGVDLADGGTWGMSLLPIVEDAERVILLESASKTFST